VAGQTGRPDPFEDRRSPRRIARRDLPRAGMSHARGSRGEDRADVVDAGLRRAPSGL